MRDDRQALRARRFLMAAGTSLTMIVRPSGHIATLLGILQPLLIVIMGAVVMTIVLAILLPIFEINNLIR